MSLHPFGSTVNNLGLQSSDVDLTLLAKITINKLANSLRKHYSDVFAIGHARVPIIKFRDGGLEVDINLNRMLGVYNSELLASYTYLDSRVKALIMLVKGFVKRREVGDASKGGLSSYSWSLMVLAFLMDRKVIRNLQGDGEEFVKTVNRGKSEMVNIAFEKVEEKIFDFDSIDFESDDGVAQLFFDFLYYVGYTHTLDNVFSIKDGGIVKATLKKYANKMVVLDPFEKDRNCAGSLRNKGDIQRVINACRQELHSLLN